VSADRRQRLIIGVAASARFATGVLMGTGLAFYVGRSGGSDLAVSLVSTAYFLGMMVFAPVWGAVADATGRRKAVLVGTSVLAVLAVLPLFALEGVWAPIGVRGLYAVFAAGFPPVMLAIVSRRGGAAGRGRSLGFYNSARGVGFTGGQLVVGLVLGLFAPPGLYAAIAAACVVCAVAVVFVDDVTEAPADPSVSLSEIGSEVRRRLLPAVDERDHLRTNGLGWLYVALALRNVTVTGVFALLPVYLPRGLGISEVNMGILLAINPAAQVVCMWLFGRVADASGRKPLVVVGMAGSAAYAVVIAAAALPGTVGVRFGVAAAAFVLIAASYSAMTTGALAFIGDVAPDDRESELMGLRSTAKGVGGVVGPLLFGALATVWSYEVAFALGSSIGFVATALVALTLVESRSRPAGAAAAADD
jgi:MFS family permease